MKNSTKKPTKKGLKWQQKQPKLTLAEKEVYNLITEEFFTIKQLSIRRKCSLQAVYKLTKSLRKKGYLSIANKKVENSEWGIQPFNQKTNQKRLHAQEFKIRILYKDENYKKIRERGNIINLDGNTIRLYQSSIEVYSGQSFAGDNSQKATSNSLKYWNRFFIRLENEFKIIIVKPRSQNICMVKHEYGNPDSPISNSTNHKVIKLYAKEDGKLWFSMDDSWGLGEHETHHRETAKQDDELIDKHLNDWREYNPPKLSEVMLLFKQHAELNLETSAGLLAVSKYMESQIPKKPSDTLKTEKIGVNYIG